MTVVDAGVDDGDDLARAAIVAVLDQNVGAPTNGTLVSSTASTCVSGWMAFTSGWARNVVWAERVSAAATPLKTSENSCVTAPPAARAAGRPVRRTISSRTR